MGRSSRWLLAAAVLLFAGVLAPGAAPGAAAQYRVVRVKNPRYRASELFSSFEDLRSKRFKELRERYDFQKAVANETDEFRRILLLRHWIHEQIKIGSPTTPTRGDAFGILDAAQKGGQFQCGHFMVVQNAVMNSVGYVTRNLGAGIGANQLTKAGHHGVNEVWSNKHVKWFLCDAKYDIHFEKKGVPLSALEIRDEILRNQGADVRVLQGPDRKPPDGKDFDWAARTNTYTWISWDLQGNGHSNFPRFKSSALVVYEDDYFRKNTWYRQGGRGVVKHWAYRANYFVPTPHRNWIEWTPNVLSVRSRVRGKRVSVTLRSTTPNFKEYQIKPAGGSWKPTPDRFSLKLTGPRHEWRLRAVNLSGVAGPEHRLVIEDRSAANRRKGAKAGADRASAEGKR